MTRKRPTLKQQLGISYNDKPTKAQAEPLTTSTFKFLLSDWIRIKNACADKSLKAGRSYSMHDLVLDGLDIILQDMGEPPLKRRK